VFNKLAHNSSIPALSESNLFFKIRFAASAQQLCWQAWHRTMHYTDKGVKAVSLLPYPKVIIFLNLVLEIHHSSFVGKLSKIQGVIPTKA
jgi:hypothetical protein